MTTAIDILLVDDDPRNLDALEAILAQPDYRLLRAADGDTALRLLLDHDVALILLDIQMPSISGFELAQIIKKTRRFRETPIVFLTAFLLDNEHVAEGYGAGAVDYITKPFNPQILRQKVAVFVELFRKTRELATLNATLELRVKERTADLEKSEASLRASARQKDDFLAILAHELRNPLAPLRMGLDLLLAQPQKVPLVERTLAAMNRQLDHMVRLIDDLLDISRLSRGLLELKKEEADLCHLVRSTAESFRPVLERRGQVLQLDATATVIVECDVTRISQIVGNLLHNATKFTPDGGTIRVSLRLDGENALVEVSDSGIGIPSDEQERVFDMFARIDHGGEAAQPGLGIGLALARRLAEMHGGWITAHSEGQGRGSTFRVALPILPSGKEAAEGGGGDEVPALDTGPARQVLVVEDNEDVASTLSDWLEQGGHSVVVARDGAEGVRLALELVPEIILCDLGLPEKDGIQVCREIRAASLPRRPLMVALTGWGRKDDRARTQDAGFDLHLVKPVAVKDLHKILQSATNREEEGRDSERRA